MGISKNMTHNGPCLLLTQSPFPYKCLPVSESGCVIFYFVKNFQGSGKRKSNDFLIFLLHQQTPADKVSSCNFLYIEIRN